ncbi:MAG: prolipoprotein diacylglyceryl transferase [Patescibacteria group bacterium]|nr:prolipoprotein diacylglyceryl transferase [Patescibacteria group bacterium]
MITHPTFSLFSLKFQTWGSLFALGATVAFFILIYLANLKKKNPDLIYNIFFLGFLGGIIGARAFYFLAHPHSFSFVDFFYFWQGRYVLFGGIIFSLLLILIYLIYKKQKILEYLNLLIIPVLSAIFFIRLGSFLVLDNIGKITTMPWAIQFLGQKRHPIDAYYLILDAFLIGLSIYLFKKDNPRLFFIILFGLAIGRIIIHFFTTFVSTWDANLNLMFWSLGLIVSLSGIYFQKNKKNI